MGTRRFSVNKARSARQFGRQARRTKAANVPLGVPRAGIRL